MWIAPTTTVRDAYYGGIEGISITLTWLILLLFRILELAIGGIIVSQSRHYHDVRRYFCSEKVEVRWK